MTDSNTLDSLPGTDDVDVSGGEGAGKTVSIKDAIGETLGKRFPDDETALKAVKDTFSYLGKAHQYKPFIDKLESKAGGQQEAIKLMSEIIENKQPNADEFVPRSELLKRDFYGDHPEYKDAKWQGIIEAKAQLEGRTREEVVNSESFQSVYKPAVAYAEVEQSRSVLSSSPRLGQVQDKIEQARADLKAGNDVAAKKAATEAVISEYKLRE